MKTKQEYIALILKYADLMRREFGVKSLRLFGSVARNQQNPDSDVDLCVEMPPRLVLVSRLHSFLESILGNSVDLIRMHDNMNKVLKKEIDRDGIYIIQ